MFDRLLRLNIFSVDGRVALAMGFALFAATVFTDYITTYELSLTVRRHRLFILRVGVPLKELFVHLYSTEEQRLSNQAL